MAEIQEAWGMELEEELCISNAAFVGGRGHREKERAKTKKVESRIIRNE